jgi:hypothetical protein
MPNWTDDNGRSHFGESVKPVLAEIHEVVVGNVGRVYGGDDARAARAAFMDYRALSFRGEGRASHEVVTWLQHGEIHKEYIPQFYNAEEA